MTTQGEDLAVLCTKLRSLERQNRQVKSAVGLTMAIMVGALLMGAGVVRQDVMDVQALVLRDTAGTVRCRLQVDNAGNVIQSFMDNYGTERIRLVVDQEGIAVPNV